jgi:hypothetical protein
MTTTGGLGTGAAPKGRGGSTAGVRGPRWPCWTACRSRAKRIGPEPRGARRGGIKTRAAGRSALIGPISRGLGRVLGVWRGVVAVRGVEVIGGQRHFLDRSGEVTQARRALVGARGRGCGATRVAGRLADTRLILSTVLCGGETALQDMPGFHIAVIV